MTPSRKFIQLTACLKRQILTEQLGVSVRPCLYRCISSVVSVLAPVTVCTGRLFTINSWRYCSKISREYYKENNLIAPLFLHAVDFEEKIAIIDEHGKHSYQDLIQRASTLAVQLEDIVINVKKTRKRINEARVAILCKNDISYVVAQWGTWIAEGVCVPLGQDYSHKDLSYYLTDSTASVVVVEESLVDRIRPVTDKLNIPLKILEESEYVFKSKKKFKFWDTLQGRPYGITKKCYEKNVYAGFYADKPAMIVYTSGTTADPKVSK